MKRWLLAICGLMGASLMLGALLGQRVVHTEIEIPAPPAEVWAVLSDAAGYAEWNPVIVRVEGEYREGASLSNTVRESPDKESVMTSKVIRFAPERELNQFGGVRGILTFDHQWLLEPIDGGTRVVQHEEYRGIGVWFWDAGWVEPAYSRANEALKQRVLALRPTQD